MKEGVGAFGVRSLGITLRKINVTSTASVHTSLSFVSFAARHLRARGELRNSILEESLVDTLG